MDQCLGAPTGRPETATGCAHIETTRPARDEITPPFRDGTRNRCRAGVGKATIYRRWSTKGMLAFEAFEAEFLAHQPLPDTGTLRGDLLAALRGWIRTVNGTATGRTLVGLIAEVQRDPALGDSWRDRFIRPVRDQNRVLIARGVDRDEIPAETDPEIALNLLFGAAYHRLLQSHLPLSDQFAQAVVTTIVAGMRGTQC